MTGEKSDRYLNFQSYKDIEFITDLSDGIKEADCLIFLDGCEYTRFSKKPEILSSFTGSKICIDHHASASDLFDASYIDSSATSTSEIIYKLFVKTPENLSKDTSETLLLGILGDTGYLQYIGPNQTEVLEIMASLIKVSGVELQTFKAGYDLISKRVFETMQELIKNTVFKSVSNWPNFVYTLLPLEYMKTKNLSDNEISDASHLFVDKFPLVIQDYSWGFVITPRSDNTCSISLRSLPTSVNVRNVVEKMGVGGGHDRAAGGVFKDTSDPTSCVEKMLTWFADNKLE